MRVVIDSNVWISALVFGGKPRQVFERVVENGDTIITCEEILSEVRRKLNQKFPDFVHDFEAILSTMSGRVVRVKLGKFNIKICRDPDDNKVLEAAKIGQAAVIISGDKDLLTLKEFEFKPILPPQIFLADG
jgi:uncharacterized protein